MFITCHLHILFSQTVILHRLKVFSVFAILFIYMIAWLLRIPRVWELYHYIKLQVKTDGPSTEPNLKVCTVCMLMFCLRIQVHESRYVSTPSCFLSLANTGSSILRCVVSCHRAQLETSTWRNCTSCIYECYKGGKCVLFVSAFACQWKIATWATKCISWACSWLTVWRSCWYVRVTDAFISRSAATTLRQPNPTPPWPSGWHSLCSQTLPVGLLLLFSDLQL